MRKLFLLLVLFVSIGYSQSKEKDGYIAFSGAFDVRNAIIGSTPTQNKPELDVLFQFAMVGNNLEVNVGYERFNAIDFEKYTIGVGYHFPLYGYVFGQPIKTTFIPSIEPTLIGRWGTWGGGLGDTQVSSHLSLGGNLAFRWDITDNFAFEYLFNALPRTDLSTMYGENMDITRDRASIAGVPIIGSNYFKFIWVINRKD